MNASPACSPGRSRVGPKTNATALGLAMLFVGGVCAPTAQAAYTMTLLQQGPNVVATGSGSIDLTALSPSLSGDGSAGIEASFGVITTGPVTITAVTNYGTITGPANFGTGPLIVANSGSGNIVGVSGLLHEVFLPSGYVSGSPLPSTSTYNNQTFASLGATPGTYVWTWGSGIDADSFTLQIGPAAVPEPPSLPLLAIGLAGLGLVLQRNARTKGVS